MARNDTPPPGAADDPLGEPGGGPGGGGPGGGSGRGEPGGGSGGASGRGEPGGGSGGGEPGGGPGGEPGGGSGGGEPGGAGRGEPGGGSGGGAGRGEPGGAGRGEPGGAGRGELPEDALRRLEERLDRASGAAERLIAEAAAESAARAANAFRRPPPAGWRVPENEEGPVRGADLELLMHLVESLRELVPPDLQRRLAEALRELLLAVRALINWYLERLERQRDEPADVEDIPISWD